MIDEDNLIAGPWGNPCVTETAVLRSLVAARISSADRHTLAMFAVALGASVGLSREDIDAAHERIVDASRWLARTER